MTNFLKSNRIWIIAHNWWTD